MSQYLQSTKDYAWHTVSVQYIVTAAGTTTTITTTTTVTELQKHLVRCGMHLWNFWSALTKSSLTYDISFLS